MTAPSGGPAEQRELAKKTAEVAALEVKLAERELDFATFQNEFRAFEANYLRTVGPLFAQLDELEALIAEATARQHPQDRILHNDAADARAKAVDSARVVNHVALVARATTFEPKEHVKKLYREIARRIHPDLSTDPAKRDRRTRLMAEANNAYAASDETKLVAILGEWENSPESVEGEGVAHDLVRIIRKIDQAERRLSALDADIDQLRSSDLWQLKLRVDDAHRNGRDLLLEMITQLQAQIDQARSRLARIA